MTHNDVGFPLGAVRSRPRRSLRSQPENVHPKRHAVSHVDSGAGHACGLTGMHLYEHLFGIFVVLVVLPVLLLSVLISLPSLLVRPFSRAD